MADTYIDAQNLTEDVSLDGEEQFVMFDDTMGKRAKLKNIKTYMNADVAKPDGDYPDLKAGNADVSAVATAIAGGSYTEESVPYKFRHTGGDVTAGGAEEDCIVGGTIAWNQQVQNGDFANGTTQWDTESTASMSVANNECTLSTSQTGTFYIKQYFPLNMGHKYFVSVHAKLNNAGSLFIQVGNAPTILTAGTAYSNYSSILAPTSTASGNAMYFGVYNAQSGDAVNFRNIMVLDLTQMFGSAVADYIHSLEATTTGKGVAFFRNMFPESYYAYNAGELRSVQGLSAHVTTGRNLLSYNSGVETVSGVTYSPQVDGSVKVAGTSTGQYPYYLIQGLRLPLGEYKISAGPDTSSDLRFIVAVDYANGSVYYCECASPNQQWFTVTKDVTAINVYMRTNGNNVSIDGTLYPLIQSANDSDTTYEPYKKHSYALDSSLTLRGVPKLVNNKVCFDGDEYRADGNVTRRYGVITFNGTQSWGTNGDKGVYKFISQISPKPKAYGRIFTSKYVTLGAGEAPDASGYMNFNSTGDAIQIRDANAMTGDAFMQMLASNPLTLIYELETPTTETASAYVNPQACDEYGTEEYISTSVVPVGHKTKYYDNLTKRIDKLPSAIAPLERSSTASTNYSVGDYLILNNTLYKVTSAISAGGTITAGSNVTATTIMAEIKALQ